MIPPLVWKAMIERLQADTTLYATGAWTSMISGGVHAALQTPATASFPYGVLTVDMIESEPAFDMESGKYEANLHLFYARGSAGAETCRDAMNRVFGNAMKVSTRLPAYGLHRHPLVLTTDSNDNPIGWVGGTCMCVRSSLGPAEGNPDVLLGSMTFVGEITAPHNP